jgi:hypothetical protein
MSTINDSLPFDLGQPFHPNPFLYQTTCVLLPSAPWDVVYFAAQMESKDEIIQSPMKQRYQYMCN